ncbi:putative bone morphogenetic protein antagonist noggin [Fasciolopsis buskii]|uniref:Putative bone morphogenetic protein antagonist noggin n=1 Tax=Fasciolopsis buskii TaxID=27845 RepID=A0A8E0S372_9TREM|nr:putative bone morphogenetic protein antagonist noggin [Fasciolopsis buski]
MLGRAYWLSGLIVLFHLSALCNVFLSGIYVAEAEPKHVLPSVPTPGIYTHDKVQIQMTRFSSSPGTRDEQKRTSKVVALNLNQSTHTNPDVPVHVGGLGLASTVHNRISLGSLTKMESKASISLRPSETSTKVTDLGWIEPTVGISGTPTAKQSGRYEDVSVRVMGQSIDPRVINDLTPDVSPFKARKLRKILAGSLDREWTSETAPRVLRQRGVAGASGLAPDGIMTSSPVDAKLVNEAYNLNFTLRHDSGESFIFSEQQAKLFRSWLIEKATCEMEFIWEDLGSLFWPRWIRRGVCLNKPSQSCSWPPGMKCQPSGSRALRLLHWKCEDAAQIQSRKRAAEQRNRRRNAINTFHSRFQDMQPAGNDFVLPSVENGALSRLSLRDTHNMIPVSGLPMMRVQLRAPRWPTETAQTPVDKREPADEFTREERRKRRARRLIKRLSVTANGYHCYWQVQKYLISDRCSCLCS